MFQACMFQADSHAEKGGKYFCRNTDKEGTMQEAHQCSAVFIAS